MITFPLGDGTADLERDRTFLPHILNSSTHDLLGIDIEHLGLKVGVVRFRAQIAEAIKTGRDPGDVVKSYLRAHSVARKGLIGDYRALMKIVRTKLLPLSDYVEEFPVGDKDAEKTIGHLRAVGDMLLRLADREEETRERQHRNLAGLLGTMPGLQETGAQGVLQLQFA